MTIIPLLGQRRRVRDQRAIFRSDLSGNEENVHSEEKEKDVHFFFFEIYLFSFFFSYIFPRETIHPSHICFLVCFVLEVCFVFLDSMSSILLVLGDGNDFEVKMTLRALEEAAPGWQIVTALTLEEVDRITEGGHVQVVLLWTCPMNVLDRAVTR